MDSCIRCLRDGGTDPDAAVVLLLDTVDGCNGGDAVLHQLISSIVQAIADGRGKLKTLHAVALDFPGSELQALGVSSLTDCFSDPCGWIHAMTASSSETLESHDAQHRSGVHWLELQQLQQELSQLGSHCCVVFAGLSLLFRRHPHMQVLQLLHQLKSSSNISSMLLPLHQDLHTPQLLSALQALSTAALQLQPVTGLQQLLISQATGSTCHGQLTFSSKRAKLGRLRVDQQLYRLLPAGGLEVFAAPQGVTVDAQALVQSSLDQHQQQTRADKQQDEQQQQMLAASMPPSAEGQLSSKLSGSMRLEISEQERAAKVAVQLPYAHQGAGKAYASGDARLYLPPAAGGFGPGVEGPGKLGHILYVRDSEEEHDSDEDPDDDLDL